MLVVPPGELNDPGVVPLGSVPLLPPEVAAEWPERSSTVLSPSTSRTRTLARAVALAALLLPLEQQAPAAPVHHDAVLLRAVDMSRDAVFSAASWPGFVATSARSWLSRPTCPSHRRGDQQDDGRRRAVGTSCTSAPQRLRVSSAGDSGRKRA